MNLKKRLNAVVAICLSVTMTATSVFAAPSMASTVESTTETVESDVYSDVLDAEVQADSTVMTGYQLETLLAKGGTVVLEKDVYLDEEPVMIWSGNAVTLDLNGHAITVKKNESTMKHLYAFDVYGDLTITDTSAEKNGSVTARGIYVQSGSKLTVDAGYIYGIDANGGSALFQYGGDIVINGGHIEQKAEGTYNFAINAAGGTVTVNGGYVGGNHGAISAGGAVVVINDGEFVCTGTVGFTDNVLYSYGTGKITIYGGTFKGDAESAAGGCCIYDANGGATVYDGNFSNSSGGDVWGTTGTTINGGTFENLTETSHVTVGSVITNRGVAYEKTAGGTLEMAKVAVIDGTSFATLEEAFAAATEGQTITMLYDAAPALKSQRAITKAAVIDLGGKTLTLTEDDLYFGTTTFKNGNIVVDPSVKPSTAVLWMFANQTLTLDNVKLTATGVTGTYLIGLDGNNADLNIINGSEIFVDNETALDLDIICVNASTGNDILVEDSKVNVTNLDGRVFFRGNYTVSGDSEITLENITKAGFRIEDGQTLEIKDNAKVTVIGEPRDGGIHLEDVTATYIKADTATVTATITEATFAAMIGDEKFVSFNEALEVANTMTGNVEVEIYGKVEYSDSSASLTGAYDSITFVGKTDDAEIYISRNGQNGYISGEANDCAVNFKDLKLSKAAGGFATDAGFMNVAFSVYRVGSVSYENCYFANGSAASGCPHTYTGCTFMRSHDKYGLWAYGSNDVVVEGCTFADYRGIKMYDEGKGTNNTTVLTVKDTDFTAVDAKPAIVLTYGKSVELEGNTYSETGVFELDKDGKPDGTSVKADIADIACMNDNYADCGILVDGKIYTTVTSAVNAGAVTSDSTVTLYYDATTEDAALPLGTTVVDNNYGVNFAEANVYMNGTAYDSLQKAIDACKSTAGDYTITLEGTVSETVSFEKAKNVNIVIDGQNKTTFTGSISWLDYGAHDAEDGVLTIKNIAFTTGKVSHDFISSTYKNRYPQLVVDNCSFKATCDTATEGYGVVAVRLKYSSNVVISNCTGENLHSFLQNTAGWNLTVDNVDVTDSKSGLALGTVQGVTVKNCDIDVKGQGIRIDASYNNDAVIEDCNVNAYIPVVVRKITTVSDISFEGANTMTASNGDNVWMVVSNTEYEEGVELGTTEYVANVTVNGTVDAGSAVVHNVLTAKGKNSYAFVSSSAYAGWDDSIWGQASNLNAYKSVVIKVFSNDTLIATTELTDHDNLKDGDIPELTWSLPLDKSNDDPYWNRTWETGMPSSHFVPTHCELWVDGTLVDTTDAKMSGPDDLRKVEWVDDPATDVPGVFGVAAGLDGEGTEANPYLINDLEDLLWFKDSVNTYTQDGSNQYKGKYVKLTADIDLAGINWEPIGDNDKNDHEAFKGIFDGDGHTISNLYVRREGGNLGFFARTGDYSEGLAPTIKNITFNNVDVSTTVTNHWTTGHGDNVGGVIANAGGETYIDNVKVTGDVYVDGCAYVGAIVGHGYPNITNCSVDANDGSYVNAGYWCAGGIIGYAGEGGTEIIGCSVKGLDVWSAYGAAAAVAGLLKDGNTVKDVTAENVDVTAASDYCMGYIAGNGEASTYENVTVSNVTATANGNAITSTDAEVAKVADAIYFDIDAAIAAWTNGKTLTLLDDVTLTKTIELNSTEKHTLNLGEYTMTAASGQHAISIIPKGRSSAGDALIINADADNPGGITAAGKACIYSKGKSGLKDRPIIKINGGIFNGSSCIQHSGSNGTNCPQFYIYGGEFTHTGAWAGAAINTNRALILIEGGTFHTALRISPDSSAYTLIKAGKFVDLKNNMGSELNANKWTFGTSKGNFDVDIFVDENGYYNVTESGAGNEDFEASVAVDYSNVGNTSANATFKYSKLSTDKSLNYTSAEVAITKNPTSDITLYKTEELDFTTNNSFKGTLNLSEANQTITITVAEGEEFEGTVKAVEGYSLKVTKTVENGVVTLVYSNTEPVSKVGDKLFGTLSEALKYAKESGSTEAVVLLADTTEAVVFGEAQSASLMAEAQTDVTLDLNGKTLTAEGTNPALTNNDSLKVMNGTVTGNVVNNGTLVLSGVKVNGNITSNSGLVEIYESTVNGSLSGSIKAYSGYYKTNPKVYLGNPGVDRVVSLVDGYYTIVQARTISIVPGITEKNSLTYVVDTETEFTIDVMVGGVNPGLVAFELDYDENYFELVEFEVPGAYLYESHADNCTIQECVDAEKASATKHLICKHEALNISVMKDVGYIDTESYVVRYTFKSLTQATAEEGVPFKLTNAVVKTNNSIIDQIPDEQIMTVITVNDENVAVNSRKFDVEVLVDDVVNTDTSYTKVYGDDVTFEVNGYYNGTQLTETEYNIEYTVSYNDGVTTTDTTYTTHDALAFAEVGTYTITYTLTAAGYTTYTGTYTVTVTSREFTAEVLVDGNVNTDTSYSEIYGSGVTFEVNGYYDGVQLGDADYEAEYVVSYDDGASTTDTTYNTHDALTFTEVGEYVINYKLTAHGYTDYTGTYTVTVTPRAFAAEVLVNGSVNTDSSYSETHDDDGVTFEVNGLWADDNSVVTGCEVSYAVSYNGGAETTYTTDAPLTFNDVGTYVITYSLTANGYTDYTATYTVIINYITQTVTEYIKSDDGTSVDITAEPNPGFDYDGYGHDFVVDAVRPVEYEVTYTDEAGNATTTTPADAVPLDKVGKYEITYTVTGGPDTGYEEVTKTVTIVVNTPVFYVEAGVMSGAERDFVDEIKLVLVYTNAENVTFDYNGVKMLDVTEAGYTYEYDSSMTFEHVYALAVEAYAEQNLDLYKANITLDYSANAATKISYDYTCEPGSSDGELDVNSNKEITRDDIMSVFIVAQADRHAFETRMATFIKADVNKDKEVVADDVTDIIGVVYPRPEYTQTVSE